MTLFRNATQSGFTLIEAVMVIVITGILAVLATSFTAPLRGYFDAIARAELSDTADTALRRMARELHAALPNSVRVNGSYIEFLPTTTGGRYRANSVGGTASCGAGGDDLLFSVPDTCFEVIGTLPAAPVVGEELVVYNTAPAYTGGNVAAIAANSTTSKILFTSHTFSADFESPSYRFQIISGPVTFACVGNTLWRYSGYARQVAQPTDITNAPLNVATNIARLAIGVNCANSSFAYNVGITQRADLVVMNLTLSNNSDSVTLLHQVHVQNVP
ncbi:MAG TPA: prepilin-type N-terminal cleavage/methylation domain-containing protein [Methylobacter sp.]|jgi:MSHA biogenesis protein MshO